MEQKTKKKGRLYLKAVFVVFLLVVGIGFIGYANKEKLRGETDKATIVAQEKAKKMSGSKTGKIPEDSKKDTGQPAPQDTGQPAPQDTGQPTPQDTGQPAPQDIGQPAPQDIGQPTQNTQPTTLPQVTDKEQKDKVVRIIRDTEAYNKRTHEKDSKKVADIPSGTELEYERADLFGWLTLRYNDEYIYIYYRDTNFVYDEDMSFDKSMQGLNGKTKKKTFLRESASMLAPLNFKTETKENAELLLLYYAKVEGSEFYYVKIEETGCNGWIPKKDVSIDMIYEKTNPATSELAQATETPTPKATEETTQAPTITATPRPTEKPTATPKSKTTSKPKATKKTKGVLTKTKKEILAYEEPDTEARVVCKISAGTTVYAKEAKFGQGWLSAEVNGEIVFFPYLHTDYAKKAKKKAKTVKSYEDTYGIVTGDGVNFRLAPGVTSKVTDCLPKGNRLKLIERKELLTGEKIGWYKAINLKTGEIRYICGLYVKEVSSLEKKEDRNTTSHEEEVTQSNNKTVVKKEEVISEDMIQVRDNVNKEEESEKKETEKKKVSTKKTAKKKEATASKKTTKKKAQTASKKTSSKASVKEMKDYTKKLCKESYNWNNKQFQYVVKIVNDESGWNPLCEYNGCIGFFREIQLYMGHQKNMKTIGRNR